MPSIGGHRVPPFAVVEMWRCGCGTRPPAGSCGNWPGTPTWCTRWRSPRTAGPWPAPATTGRCGCGTRPIWSMSARDSMSLRVSPIRCQASVRWWVSRPGIWQRRYTDPQQQGRRTSAL